MCPVCFTGGDPVARETLNAGIGVLLGVTVVVLGLFGRFFLKLARRSRPAAHLVDHDAGRLESRPLPSGINQQAGRPDDKRAA